MNAASSFLNRMVGTAASLVNSSTQNIFTYNLNLPSSQTLMTSPNCPLNSQDRKSIEKCYHLMETVIRLCQQPRMFLKNSPPFILDILPDIYNLLNIILTNDPNILQSNLYLRLFISNLTNTCKRTVRLFQNQKEKIFDEATTARRQLTMNSLIFSHMFSELKAEFPDGKFIGSRFRITKRQAEDFWNDSFGADRTIVSWEEFRNELNKVHKFCVGNETHALKNTIDLTCNDHISNFEFDVFTRLFHPWDSLLKNWQWLAVTHPGYVAFMTYDEVKQRLQQYINKPGSYVFRLSCTRLGQWAIGYVAPDKKIYQTIPQNKSLIQSLVDGSREGFYLYPDGRPKNIDLSFAIQSNTEGKVHVSPEQYQIYCEMGTTFEMCKICDEQNKNVKLEPCGHLLCRPCLHKWQEKSDGEKNCPFCRCEIKGTENVLIESYNPADFKKENNSIKSKTSTISPPPRPERTVQQIINNPLNSPSSPPPIPPKRVGQSGQVNDKEENRWSRKSSKIEQQDSTEESAGPSFLEELSNARDRVGPFGDFMCLSWNNKNENEIIGGNDSTNNASSSTQGQNRN
uniref:E3 ubiquitin-protein ligase CBL n=1 Tax=Meloidogyne incognita TaxID=6306 RepID=A0A914LDN7_MELIC